VKLNKNLFLAILVVVMSLYVGLGSEVEGATYPSKPVTVIVQYPAGGTLDIGARTIAPYWEKYLGAHLTIVNQPGAGGEIGVTAVCNAKPDGYTIGMWSCPPQNIVMAQRKTIFNLDSFEWIGNQQADPYIMVVRTDDKRFNSLKDFIDYAKNNPGDLSMGITGAQTATDLVTERIMAAEKIKVVKVPFDGTPQVRAAVLGGHLDVMVEGTVALDAAVRDGQLKILCVFDSERYSLYPNIPTYEEVTGNDITSVSFRSFIAPKGISSEILLKLRDSFGKAMKDPEFIEKAKRAKLPLRYLNGQDVYTKNQNTQKAVNEIIAEMKKSK
jgi:tripartite-type tricarboxylate transporter receptor subunit TctC